MHVTAHCLPLTEGKARPRQVEAEPLGLWMAPARFSERGSFPRPSSLIAVATFECATVKGCSIHHSASPTFPPPLRPSVYLYTALAQQPPDGYNNNHGRRLFSSTTITQSPCSAQYIETTQTHHNHEVVPPAALAGRRCSSAPLLHRRHHPQVLLRGIAQGHSCGWPLHGRGMGRPEAFVAEARWHQHLHFCRCMF